MKTRSLLTLTLAAAGVSFAAPYSSGQSTKRSEAIAPTKASMIQKRPTQFDTDIRAILPNGRRMTAGVDGGLAGAPIFNECFESGFTPGVLSGQNGWTTFAANVNAPVITDVAAPEGTLAISVPVGPGAQGSFNGPFSPLLPAVPAGDYTGTVKLNIPNLGGANYDVVFQAVSQGFITARMSFDFAAGAIFVLTDPGTGLAFVDTGATYTPNVTHDVKIELDTVNAEIRYFLDNTLIFTGSIVGGTLMDQFVGLTDNFHLPGEAGKYDCVVIEPGVGSGGSTCTGDVNGDGNVNVTDLLAVIGAWGPCAAPCPPDINSDGNVNVTDLLAVIGAWGPCPVPSGACCLGDGSCSTQTLANCVSAGGTYQGNGSDCSSVSCPVPQPNDVCDGATVISLPFNENVDVANYTPDITPGSNSSCVAGVFTMSGSWWYTFTATESTTVTVSTCATPDEDTLVTAYSGSCAGLTQVACDDDSCVFAPAFGGSQFQFAVTAGTTYYFHFETYSGGITGPVNVSITSP